MIREVNVIIYYRPSENLQALRIETPAAIAKNKRRLSILLDAIRLQGNAPELMEPYPLYMAGRMVEHLGCILSVLGRATTQEMVATDSTASHNVERIFQVIHAHMSYIKLSYTSFRFLSLSHSSFMANTRVLLVYCDSAAYPRLFRTRS